MAKGHRSQIKRERNENQKDTRPSAKLSYARVSVQKACYEMPSEAKMLRQQLVFYHTIQDTLLALF